ncbi:hypothetical protein [Pseudomonas sp. GZD-222]|uniref:hypothetical protein n=1 Tax=Pseudomonas sp. GZD-222 TaxID=3404805 RepID=UPI003BB664BB
MKAFLCILLGCAAFTTLAQASSDQAWKEHYKQMNEHCIAASTLKNVKVLGKPAEFDDRVGYSALLLEGRYPQKHMNNRKGTELCLYERQRKTAFVTEWAPATP